VVVGCFWFSFCFLFNLGIEGVGGGWGGGVVKGGGGGGGGGAHTHGREG